MWGNRVGNYSRALLVVGLSLLGTSANLRADDTEIFQTKYDASLTGRPKVLIALDDSGSMATAVPNSKPPYDPNGTYDSAVTANRIYWSTNGQPPAANSSQWFDATKNRCAESYNSLTNNGFFQTKATRWVNQVAQPDSCVAVCKTNPYTFLRTSNNKCYANSKFTGTSVNSTQQCTAQPPTPGYWTDLSTSAQTPLHVECQVDVTNNNQSNGPSVANGFPKTNVLDTAAFSATTAATSNVSWNTSYTFYTSHYMNYVSDPDTRDQTRMEIASDVITNLIAANTGIDFGLLEFNGNWSGTPATNGGRVIQRIIKNMSTSDRSNLVNMVNTITAGGSTPLCEATTEVYRYLAGDKVVYGLQDDKVRGSGFGGDIVPRDQKAESGVNYISPASDCAYTYVVIMTDGMPQNDTDANTFVEGLTHKTCGIYDSDGQGKVKNCLVEIARYMANTDLDHNTTNGNQYGITYTIGFTTDQPLLKDAAAAGGGKYFTADNSAALSAAFQGAILSILTTDSTFTSAAVAVDSFSHTESRDDVFYAMFKPADRVDWHGNIKKLKLAFVNGVATLVDSKTQPAISATTHFIKDTAITYWGTTADGPHVESGGVGALLAAHDPTTRKIKFNSSSGTLLDFKSANVTYTTFGLADATSLFTYFGVANQTELDKALSWARGADAYDEDGDGNVTETRPWIMADILHSQPVVVNYGALGSHTIADPDLRIVVGTNGGFAHMFDNKDGSESWAFFPKELAAVIRKRAANTVTSQHVYGVDNTPVIYTIDANNDGTIKAADGDKAYLYLTLGRGGDATYALDITDPDNPAFLWMIDATKSGFRELGQSWSRPVVTYIPGYKDGNGKPKPVLIFGAGYDTNKDNSGVATADSKGRGLYVVDAVTGALVWKVTPAVNSSTNMQETGLVHSVAAPVTILDSNGDGITDRVYMADTGGNVWRVDMPGPTLPTSSQVDFRIVKFAAMNGGTDATDRRFFSAPDIVRTSYHGVSFDAVAIGSGDRNNPNAKDNKDQFYMMRDYQTTPYFTAYDHSKMCGIKDQKDDNRCALPILEADLYDITSNKIQTGTDQEKIDAVTALVAAKGWRLDLTADGEKSLSKSVTIGGTVYFTTFSPVPQATNLCVPEPGTGRDYAVRLGDATATRDINQDGKYERSMNIIALIPASPTPITPKPPTTCTGPCPAKDTYLLEPNETGLSNTNFVLPDPYGTFWYREEF